MSTTTTTTLPFPPELLRCIVDIAAQHAPTGAALALVSRAFHAWSTPLLYGAARLSSAPRLAAFAAALAAHPARARHVRRLAIACAAPPKTVHAVRTHCANVTSFAAGFAWQPAYCAPPKTGAPATANTTPIPTPVPTPPASRPSSPEPRGPDAATLCAAEEDEIHLLGLACRDGFDGALLPRSLARLRVQLPALPLPPTLLPPDAEPHALYALAAHVPALRHLALVLPAGALPDDGGGAALKAATACLLELHGGLETLLVQVIGGDADALARTFAFRAAPRSSLETAPTTLETTPTTPTTTAATTATIDPRLVVEARPAAWSAFAQWDDAARFGDAELGVWADAARVVRDRRLQQQQARRGQICA